MKKRFLISIIIIFSLVNSCFAVQIKPTLIQINQENTLQDQTEQVTEDEQSSYYNFENNSAVFVETDEQEIENPEEKYQEYAITLDKSSIQQDNELNKSGALFILGAEKVDNVDNVKAVNMFWDQSKNFTYSYYQDSKNISPMQSLFNSSYLVTNINSETKAYIGQAALSDFDGTSVYFIGVNQTNFDNGFKLLSCAENFNVSVGAFNSTLDNTFSGGAVISTKSFSVPKVAGKFIFGGGYYSNELENNNKNTGGVFAEYRYKKLKLNLQGAKSKYANSGTLDTGLYFTPEIQLTDSISVRTRFVKNIYQNVDQNQIGIAFKPVKNNPKDFEFSVNAANSYTLNAPTSQIFTFSTRFKI